MRVCVSLLEDLMVGCSFPFHTLTLMPSVRGHSANWGGVGGGSGGSTGEWKEAIRKQCEGRVGDIIGQSLRVREAGLGRRT